MSGCSSALQYITSYLSYIVYVLLRLRGVCFAKRLPRIATIRRCILYTCPCLCIGTIPCIGLNTIHFIGFRVLGIVSLGNPPQGCALMAYKGDSPLIEMIPRPLIFELHANCVGKNAQLYGSNFVIGPEAQASDLERCCSCKKPSWTNTQKLLQHVGFGDYRQAPEEDLGLILGSSPSSQLVL